MGTTYHAEKELLKVDLVALAADELDKLVDMALKDGKVGDLCSHKAGTDQGTLVSPDIIIRGEDALAKQWGGTLASQGAHTKVLELESEDGLDDTGVAGVDGGSKVGVGGEGQAILSMTLLEQSQEAKFACGSEISEDNISSHEGIFLLEFDGRETAIVTANSTTNLPSLKEADDHVDEVAQYGQAARQQGDSHDLVYGDDTPPTARSAAKQRRSSTPGSN